MSAQKTLVNLDVQLVPNETIITEFIDVVDAKTNKKTGSYIRMILGILFLFIGLYRTLNRNFNPLSFILILPQILENPEAMAFWKNIVDGFQYLLDIPLLFILIGVLLITRGISSLFHKFFTFLYRETSKSYNQISTKLLATNYRLIYQNVGEGGVSATMNDYHYDKIEKIELFFPQQVFSLNAIITSIIGIGISISIFIPVSNGQSLFGHSYYSLVLSLIGLFILYIGYSNAKFSQKYYFLFIHYLKPSENATFQILAKGNDPNVILNACREYKIKLSQTSRTP